MGSPQLALCAAVAAAAVTMAPAYAADPYGARTDTVSVTRPPAAHGGAHPAPTTRLAPTRLAPTRLAPTRLAPTRLAAAVPGPAPFRPTPHAAPRRELSSTSAVGLVLAGGAVLVIAGQLLRLRLRLRRERQGGTDEG
ncbi:hypothetical protein [Streptomyces sp. NRRL S-1448]|uniref:hypothetical protein n=1 Tax=Streptomyces sp. NRRL S-1448 TaxID=1463883 RepID=UPI0004BE5D12|nr:hypothetical protein [Streptomyces sp. NRRL S-1448]